MADDCILWSRTIHHTGYGVLQVAGRQYRAHRWTWEQAHGPIPSGMVVMHTCDKPPCVNLAHLRLGTPAENTQDRNAKGRNPQTLKTHCIRGHPLDRCLPTTGWRWCSICARQRHMERRTQLITTKGDTTQ